MSELVYIYRIKPYFVSFHSATHNLRSVLYPYEKINDTNEALEATSNPTSAEDEVTQHEAYRRTLTTQYGEAIYDTKADKARNSEILRTKGLKSSENYE